eukprot:2826823-Prymnesium_polylepis.1
MCDFRPPTLTRGRPGVPAHAPPAHGRAWRFAACACAAWRAPGPAQCAMHVGYALPRGSSPATPLPPPTRAKRAAAPSRGCRRSASSRLGCSCRQGAPPCR